MPNSSNFRRSLQSLLWRYTAENLQVTLFVCSFRFLLKSFFHKVYCFRFYRKWITWVTNCCKKPIERRIVTSRYHGNKISGIGVCILGGKKKYMLLFCSWVQSWTGKSNMSIFRFFLQYVWDHGFFATMVTWLYDFFLILSISPYIWIIARKSLNL